MPKSSQSLADLQKAVDDWAQTLEKPYWSPMSQLARMIEEVGELARIYNHEYGDKVKKHTEAPDDLKDEMGDILFDLICMANSEGVDLTECLEKVLDKAQVRDKDRFAKKNNNLA